MPVMNESALFNAALKLPADQRRPFLLAACADQPDLLAEVEGLLAAHAGASDDFLAPASYDPRVTVDAPEAFAPGEVLARRYKLLERIGAGGMGTVWVAEQLEPVRRLVAVKLIKPGMDSRQVLARFEAERQALALMDHPHIAKVFDGGVTERQRPFFAMEYVKGVPLTEYCDQACLSVQERLKLLLPVCQAIQHAHQKGVIHRDLKPSNILVCLYDGQPIAKVIDFGLAKAMHQPLTERTLHTAHGIMLGTPLYMSPEQAELNNLDVDTRTDIYSLGVILYELLTGTTPLEDQQVQAAALMELLRMIKEYEPAKPSQRVTGSQMLPSIAARRGVEPAQLPGHLRGDLDWIVMKSLEKDRRRRYETASGLARDLERYLHDEPIEARPPSAWYRGSKFARKHRRGLAALGIGAILVATALSALGMAWSERLDREATATRMLSEAVEDASLTLGQALASPIGRDTEWRAARSDRGHVRELLRAGRLSPEARERAEEFLRRFDRAAATRDLAENIEEVVITSATHEDKASWERMERQFREVFRQRGIDLDQMDPADVAQAIRKHSSSAQLADALELWIGTRGQLSALGGPRATAANMQPWADAMYAADADPLRTGIRRFIYRGRPPKPEEVEDLVRGIDLPSLPARTLSWMATVFAMAGATKRADEVFQMGRLQYPGDLMLNFDYAYMMAHQERWQEAIRYYSRCLAVRPDVPGIWRSLGVALRHTRELPASRQALERATLLEPDHAATHVDL
ncbi:MAG TPA: protein kinase, partial [Pirellulaceae bacterium]